MKNVNRFLESPWRSDLFGFNMASSGTASFNKRKADENAVRLHPIPTGLIPLPASAVISVWDTI